MSTEISAALTTTAAPPTQRPPVHTHAWQETCLLSQRSLAGVCCVVFLFLVIRIGTIHTFCSRLLNENVLKKKAVVLGV